MSAIFNPIRALSASVVQPPFAQLPDPARVFAKRAERESGIRRGSFNPNLLVGYR